MISQHKMKRLILNYEANSILHFLFSFFFFLISYIEHKEKKRTLGDKLIEFQFESMLPITIKISRLFSKPFGTLFPINHGMKYEMKIDSEPLAMYI